MQAPRPCLSPLSKRTSAWRNGQTRIFHPRPTAIRSAYRRNAGINNENNGEHERWRYLFFINYIDIVTYGDNWDLFKDNYNFYGKGSKATLVRWIAKVNRARTVTHHAEKGPLSKDQVAYVMRVHELVTTHIQQGVPVDPKVRYLTDGDQVPASVTIGLPTTAAS